jgi:hypothetical protein
MSPGKMCVKAIVQNAGDRGFDVIGVGRAGRDCCIMIPITRIRIPAEILLLNNVRVRDIDRQPGSFCTPTS